MLKVPEHDHLLLAVFDVGADPRDEQISVVQRGAILASQRLIGPQDGHAGATGQPTPVSFFFPETTRYPFVISHKRRGREM